MQVEGSTFLKIAILACWSQLKAGLYFILELPTCAAWWKTEDLQRLVKEPSVTEIVLDQCAYGLASCDDLGWAPVKKSTKILTNLQSAPRNFMEDDVRVTIVMFNLCTAARRLQRGIHESCARLSCRHCR